MVSGGDAEVWAVCKGRGAREGPPERDGAPDGHG